MDDFDEFDEEENRELHGIEKTVEDLNEDFFKLLCRLKKYKEALGKPDFYNYMLKNLFDLYKREYERLYLDYDFNVKREMFEKREKLRGLTPRAWKFLFLHNENIPAKLIIEDVNIDTEEYFRNYEAENDEARPDYMRKMWLTRRDKKEAKKAAKQARKAEKAAEKEAARQARREAKVERRRKSGRKNKAEVMQIPEVKGLTASQSDAEAKKQARLRALEESRRQKKREQEQTATSPQSPKSGTQSGGSESSSKA